MKKERVNDVPGKTYWVTSNNKKYISYGSVDSRNTDIPYYHSFEQHMKRMSKENE